MARGGTRTKKKPAAGKRRPAPATPRADKVARGALAALVGVAAVAILFAFEVPGMIGRAAGEAMGSAGLNVRSIDIMGVEQMDSEPVYAIALGQRTRALPLVDVGDVRGQLLEFPYVKDARVSRRYPDALVIDVVERTPAALWQGEDRLFLIDEEGVVLERVPVAQMPDLPLVIGAGANRELASLGRLLARVPSLRPQIVSSRWVGGRRWDLNVATGEIIALPEGERAASEALEKFVALDRKAALLGVGVERYDLRLPGKAVARSPEFVDARIRQREVERAARNGDGVN